MIDKKTKVTLVFIIVLSEMLAPTIVNAMLTSLPYGWFTSGMFIVGSLWYLSSNIYKK